MNKEDSSDKKKTDVPSEIIRGITYKRVKGSEDTIQPWKALRPSLRKDPKDPRSKSWEGPLLSTELGNRLPLSSWQACHAACASIREPWKGPMPYSEKIRNDPRAGLILAGQNSLVAADAAQRMTDLGVPDVQHPLIVPRGLVSRVGGSIPNVRVTARHKALTSPGNKSCLESLRFYLTTELANMR